MRNSSGFGEVSTVILVLLMPVFPANPCAPLSVCVTETPKVGNEAAGTTTKPTLSEGLPALSYALIKNVPDLAGTVANVAGLATLLIAMLELPPQRALASAVEDVVASEEYLIW